MHRAPSLSRRTSSTTLAAQSSPVLTLRLKKGGDVLDAARELVEDLRLAGEKSGG